MVPITECTVEPKKVKRRATRSTHGHGLLGLMDTPVLLMVTGLLVFPDSSGHKLLLPHNLVHLHKNMILIIQVLRGILIAPLFKSPSLIISSRSASLKTSPMVDRICLISVLFMYPNPRMSNIKWSMLCND